MPSFCPTGLPSSTSLFDKPLEAIPGALSSPAVHTIVVEAVANAVRHGGADWIRITFTLDEGDGVLSVLNNGQEKPTVELGWELLI
jgi:signal transduction histidine kinase